MFARRVDVLPFEAYDEIERCAEQAVRAAGGGYGGRVMRDLDLRHARTTASACRPLPEPAAETIDLAALLQQLDPVLDDDIFPTIKAFTDYETFERVVLGDKYEGNVHATLRCPVERVRELRRKRYVQRLRRALPNSFACRLFWVAKSDGVHDRTIFNGIPWNAAVREPHPTRVEPVHKMLTDLTEPGIEAYAAFDLTTFFVQLKCESRVAGTWIVRLADGSLWRVTGVPMGISWAPAVAQAVALALVRVFVRGLPDRLREGLVTSKVYIDNIIFALRDAKCLPELAARFRAFATSQGAVLKEADTVLGAEVDWLGVVIRAGTREMRLRPRFLNALEAAGAVLKRSDAPAMSVRAWWRLIALAVYARWVRQDGLESLLIPLRWLSRAANELSTGTLSWSSGVRPWAGVDGALLAAYAAVAEPFVHWCPPARVLLVGESDAASTGFLAMVIVNTSTKEVFIARLRRARDVHINESEFEAAACGFRDAVRHSAARNGTILWRTDNTTTVSWLQRQWASAWHLNETLSILRKLQRAANLRLLISHIAGKICTPDVLTRCAVGAGQCVAPTSWARTGAVFCTCEQTVQFCEHVRGLVTDTARGQCAACVPPRTET